MLLGAVVLIPPTLMGLEAARGDYDDVAVLSVGLVVLVVLVISRVGLLVSDMAVTAARERTLRTAAAELVAAGDRAGIHAAALRALERLVGPTAVTSRLVDVTAADEVELVAGGSRHQARIRGRALAATLLPYADAGHPRGRARRLAGPRDPGQPRSARHGGAAARAPRAGQRGAARPRRPGDHRAAGREPGRRPADPGGAARAGPGVGDPRRRPARAAERGQVPRPGAELLGRHPAGGPGRRGHLPEPVGGADVRLPTRRPDRAQLRGPVPPRRPAPGPVRPDRRARQPGRQPPARAAPAPPHRGLAGRRGGRQQPAGRPERARHRGDRPRRRRAQAVRDAADPRGLPRRAHRAGQPGPVHRPGGARAGPARAGRHDAGGPAPRPGRLQDGERRPRARRGRLDAAGRRRAARCPGPPG